MDTIAQRAAFWSHQIGAWYEEGEDVLYLSEPGDLSGGKENALGLAFAYLFREHGRELFRRKGPSLNMDAWMARLSLLAGDAAWTRLAHSLSNPRTGGGGGVTEDPDDPSREIPMPLFLREMELAPFGMGLDFSRSLHTAGKLDQLNAAYSRPPVSSIEVLEPSLYLAENQFLPQAIAWTDLQIQGARPIWDDSLGAGNIILLLKQRVPQVVAAESAHGWRGDRWLVYAASGTGRDHVVWRTRWEDSDSADGFFSAMREGLLRSYPAASAGTSVPGVFKLSGPERFAMLRRTDNGLGVFYADAANSGFLKALEEKFAGPLQER